METSADVVIIGGGIVGASIAYHLTQEGAGRVLVLERECVQGLGSTGRATGGVRAQFSTPIQVRMSIASLEVIRTFEQRTGVDPGYRPNGYLFLATSAEQLEVLSRLADMQREHGYTDVRMVSREEVQRMVPLLFTEDVLGASFGPRDGFIEPLSLLKGFTDRAIERGAEVVTDAEVLGIQVERGAVSGVTTRRGTIATRCAVNAAGPWAAAVARMAGITLPVEPLRRHVAGTQPFPDLEDGTPMVIELGTSFHFRKDHSGGGGVMLLWNDPAEPRGEDLRFDPAWLRGVLPMAWRRLPRLREAQVSPRRSWAGLYEMTSDHHPVLGQAPGLEGLYLANGFSGHGVMHSPATGRLLAELIVHGEARLLDIAPLGLERFAKGELMEDIGVL